MKEEIRDALINFLASNDSYQARKDLVNLLIMFRNLKERDGSNN